MSYPDIIELSNAFTLCTCSGTLCSTQCHVCYSPKWESYACVQQLWREHAASDAGKAAGQRFNDMIEHSDEYKIGDHVSLAEVMQRIPVKGGRDPVRYEYDVLSDEQIVERAIDTIEQLGMVLEPWQATALRAILLHGGDVAIGVRYR